MGNETGDQNLRDILERLTKHHEVLLAAMRAREGEILKYLGFMLPAIGGFGWLLTRDNISLTGLVLGFLSIQFLLWWGGYYSLALSYNFRCLQAQIKKFELRIHTDDAMLAKWQGMPKVHESDVDFPPEIFRVQLNAFLIGELLVGIGGTIFVLLERRFPTYHHSCCGHYHQFMGVFVLVVATILWIGILLRLRQQFCHKYCNLLAEKPRET